MPRFTITLATNDAYTIDTNNNNKFNAARKTKNAGNPTNQAVNNINALQTALNGAQFQSIDFNGTVFQLDPNNPDAFKYDSTSQKFNFTPINGNMRWIDESSHFVQGIIDPATRQVVGNLQLKTDAPYLNTGEIDTVIHIDTATNVNNVINAKTAWTLQPATMGGRIYDQYVYWRQTDHKLYKLQVERNNPANEILHVYDPLRGSFSQINNPAILGKIKNRVADVTINSNSLNLLDGQTLDLELTHKPLRGGDDLRAQITNANAGAGGFNPVVANQVWTLKPVVEHGRKFNEFVVYDQGVGKIYKLQIAADGVSVDRERLFAFSTTDKIGEFVRIPAAQAQADIQRIKPIIQNTPTVPVLVQPVFALHGGTQDIHFEITHNAFNPTQNTIKKIETNHTVAPAANWSNNLAVLANDYYFYHLENGNGNNNTQNGWTEYAVWLKDEGKLFRYEFDPAQVRNIAGHKLWVFDPQLQAFSELNLADSKNRMILDQIRGRMTAGLAAPTLVETINAKIEALVPLKSERKYLYAEKGIFTKESKLDDDERFDALKSKDPAWLAIDALNKQAQNNADSIINQPTENAKQQRDKLKAKVTEYIIKEKDLITELQTLKHQIDPLYQGDKETYKIPKRKVDDQIRLAKARLEVLETLNAKMSAADSLVLAGKTTLGLERKPIPGGYTVPNAAVAPLPPGAYIVPNAQYATVLANIKASTVTGAAGNAVQTQVVARGQLNASGNGAIVDVSDLAGTSTILVMPNVTPTVGVRAGAPAAPVKGGILSVTSNAVISQETAAVIDSNSKNEFVKYEAIIRQAVKACEEYQKLKFDHPVLVSSNPEEAKIWYLTWKAMGVEFTNESAFKPKAGERKVDWEKSLEGKIDDNGNPKNLEKLSIASMKHHLQKDQQLSPASLLQEAERTYNSPGLGGPG